MSFSADNERDIATVAAKTEYSVDAFFFLLFTLQSSMQSTSIVNHIDASQFCWKLRDSACWLYGNNAKQQLAEWGVHTTDDFGSIMYSLIENGLALKNEQDAIEQFSNVYDFGEAFADCPRMKSLQFSLSLLFIVTTIAAVYAAGAKSTGFYGGMSAMFSSWIALIGGFCVYSGLRDSSRGRLLLLLIGVPILAIGIAGFCLTVSR